MGSTISLGYIVVLLLMIEYLENTKVHKKFNAKMSLNPAFECYSVTNVDHPSVKTSRKAGIWRDGMPFEPSPPERTTGPLAARPIISWFGAEANFDHRRRQIELKKHK